MTKMRVTLRTKRWATWRASAALLGEFSFWISRTSVVSRVSSISMLHLTSRQWTNLSSSAVPFCATRWGCWSSGTELPAPPRREEEEASSSR
uniref:Putative secreted protein n=1 Tax=Ixodes ricinus TaxID=34613 RepID=A0A6B0UCP4_IXORI